MSDVLLGAGMLAFAVGTLALGLAASGVAPPPTGALGVVATLLGGVLVVLGAIFGENDDVRSEGEGEGEGEPRETE